MKQEKRAETVGSLVETTEATIIVDRDGQYVAANQEAADICKYSLDELQSLSIPELVVEEGVKHGRNLEQAFCGNRTEVTAKISRGDGSLALIEVESEPVETLSGTHLKATISLVREVASGSATRDPENPADAYDIEDLDSDTIAEIAENIRVDAPDGEMVLNKIMLDLAVAHNELEQYKVGSLSLYKALDERLVEEEKRNPNSPEAAVLRETRDTAFGVYLRVQRGDEELHGHRDGDYSGYFN